VENFLQQLKMRQEKVDEALHSYFRTLSLPQAEGLKELRSSIEYSLLRGGKRFRPVLCLLVAETFAVTPKRVLPLACAIEMIHTYSLIHDDLPCMDNDDIRRGEPTNHKVFGETTALLAGDALLTEAFRCLAEAYAKEADLGLRLVTLLSSAAGLTGMVGGQAIDLKAQKEKTTLAELKRMHELKTGALIRVCAEGAAIACGLLPDKVELCRKFGESLGLAFQIKDDLLDSSEAKTELGSYPGLIGLTETQNDLSRVTEAALQILQELGAERSLLRQLIEYNLHRQT
jgi:geranylgeranyl diphosphate synthase type II